MCSAHPTIGPYICFAWRKRVGSHKGYSELVLDDLLLPEDLNRQVADFRRCFSLFSFLPSVHHTCSLVACAHYYWSMHPLPPGVMHVQHPSFNFQLVTCAYKTKIKRSDGPSFHSPLHKHPAYVTRPKFYNSLGSIRCLGRSASKRESNDGRC